MDIRAGLAGVKRYAIPSVIVGVVTLLFVLYACAIAPNSEGEAMKSLARNALIAGAVLQALLVVLLLIPGSAPLRRRHNLNPMVSNAPSDAEVQRLAPLLFIWFAIGEAGGLFVFVAALLGMFVYHFLPDGMMTLIAVLGGFAVYSACFVFCIILPLARANALQDSA